MKIKILGEATHLKSILLWIREEAQQNIDLVTEEEGGSRGGH